MELFLFWFGLAIVVGVIAGSRGQNGFGKFLLAVVISPLLAGIRWTGSTYFSPSAEESTVPNFGSGLSSLICSVLLVFSLG
jgi:hypothetical protein